MNSFTKKWKSFLLAEGPADTFRPWASDTVKPGFEKATDPNYRPPGMDTLMPTSPVEAALSEMGYDVKKKIKSGDGGLGLPSDVYHVINLKTSQESAVKVVESKGGNSKKAEQEYQNYTFLKSNRDTWPKEVARHFVKVYQTIERGEYYFIFMEFLTEPPKNIKSELFASGDLDPCEASKGKKRKEAKIMADPISVERLISYIVSTRDIKQLLLRFNAKDGQDRNAVEAISHNALAHYVGRTAYSSEELNYDFWASQAVKYRKSFDSKHVCLNKRGQKLLDIIFVYVLHAIGDTYRRRMGKDSFEELAQIIEEAYVDRIFIAPVIPMTTEPVDFAARKGEDEEMTKKIKSMNVGAGEFSQLYPEVQSVMHAMQYATKEEFVPADVHIDNIMMRPSTNDLVIVDVGNFRLT